MSRIDPHLDETIDAYAQLDLEVIRNVRLTNALRALTEAVEHNTAVWTEEDEQILSDSDSARAELFQARDQARAVLDQTNPQEQP